MKQKLLKSLLLLCAFIVGSIAWAEDVTFDASSDKSGNTTAGEQTITKDGITMTVSNGILGTDDNQYRVYKSQTLTISSTVGNITGIEFTCTASGTTKYGPGCFAEQEGYSYSDNIGTWSGSSEVVTFTASSNQVRATQIVVTYVSSGGDVTPTCASPTFSPAAGSFNIAQNVTISTKTDGATIYYTTDGNDPTTSSTKYTSAIAVSKTTTIKAIAAKDGYNNSSVTSATYKIVAIEHAGTKSDPYTVADAINAIDLNSGVTEVYAKGIVSKIVTAYNSTYGNISYNISADGTTEGLQLQAFRGKGKNGDWFTSEYDIMVGDEVIVYGNLTKYSSTYEFAQDNQLVSLKRNPVNVTIGEAGYATMYLPYAVKYAGAAVREPIGVWTFDDPANPLAGTGVAALTPATHTKASKESGNSVVTLVKSLEDAKITTIEGPADGNGAISVPVGSSLLASGIASASQTTYTLMFDVSAPDVNKYSCFFNNQADNGKDGSFFIKDGGVGVNSLGLGYHGSIATNTWYRVVLVVEANVAKVYVDGELVGKGTGADATHWQLNNDILFCADDDHEEKPMNLAEIRFWDQALNAAEVAELGTCVGSAEALTIPEAKGAWTFDDSDNLTAGTGVSTMTATSGVITNGDGSVTVPVGDKLEMTTNLAESSLKTYTLMMDVKFPDVSSYTALFQNKLANDGDASLFIKNGQIGLGGTLGYNGTIKADTWYRVVFVVDNLYGTLYVDGEKISQSSSQVAQHWQLSTGVLFFRDDDVDEKVVTTTEIRFWDEALSAAQVALLSTVGTEIKNDEEILAGSPSVYTAQITDTYLTLDEVDGTIPAATPVILKAAPGTYTFAPAENVSPIEDNDLKGTLEPIDATGKYVLAKPEGEKVGFYLADKGTIAANKAYLEVPAAGVKAFYFEAEESETAIANVNVNDNKTAIYNLAGQRLSKMQKGINIVNGKKVLK